MKPSLTPTTTFGDKYGYAMSIMDQFEADAYFEECVVHQLAFGKSTRDEAILIEKSNLGHWAGYYDNATRERVERLFRCSHPVFGATAANGSPTAAESFVAGISRV